MKKNGMVFILFWAALLLGACASKEAKDEVSQMDFQAEMELRAPDPAAGERPKILFVGNSQATFMNCLGGSIR